MRRPSKTRTPRISADSQRLAQLAQALVQAGSRIEERAWEKELGTLLRKQLKNDHQATIDAALDHLYVVNPIAYDALMESIEADTETCTLEHEGKRYDVLLLAAPALAWTRFAIAAGPIPGELVTTLTAHLFAHVLATDAAVSMAPTLYAIDQLPRSHVDTHALTRRLGQAALTGSPVRQPANPLPTAPFLADTRYLVAVVVVPEGTPMFRWQMPAAQNDILGEREKAFNEWRTQALPNVERLLPGCGVDLLLPDAYHMACRDADKQIRPVSIHAAVHYLTHALGIEATSLSAILAGFGEESQNDRVDEYRISFTLKKQRDVIYGIVWPLYGDEDAEMELPPPEGSPAGTPGQTPAELIIALLKEAGITDIKRHEGTFPMEFCDDCGAPLFSDKAEELVHAEMPEDTAPPSPHLH